MTRLYIYCAGSFGNEVHEIAQNLNTKNPLWSGIAYVDDVLRSGTFINDVLVLGFEEFKRDATCSESTAIVIANGDPKTRQEIRKKLQIHNLDKYLVSVVSPDARISPRAHIGRGSVICSGSQISFNSQIGQNCIVYHDALIAHDVTVEDDSVISSQANLAGRVHVGHSVFVGMGALVRESVNIGDSSVIGMGSVVTGDVQPNSLTFGNPARNMGQSAKVNVYKKR